LIEDKGHGNVLIFYVSWGDIETMLAFLIMSLSPPIKLPQYMFVFASHTLTRVHKVRQYQRK